MIETYLVMSGMSQNWVTEFVVLGVGHLFVLMICQTNKKGQHYDLQCQIQIFYQKQLKHGLLHYAEYDRGIL